MDANPKKYLVVLLITALVFGTAFLLSDYFYNERLTQVRGIEEEIGRSMLESEIQFALLSDAACDLGEEGNPLLIDEINLLARRLSAMESERGAFDPQVIDLKKYYTLLQVKDYLLLRERARQCGDRPLSILYFYSNQGDCAECEKTGLVLSAMREEHDTLHVYAFDYHLDLSVVQSLKSIYKLTGELPALVIDRKPYYGFRSKEELEALIPDLALEKKGELASSTPSR